MRVNDSKSTNSNVANPTPVIVVWSILCSLTVCFVAISAISAIAQAPTDKPLDARSRAALVEELKGVVSKTLSDGGEAAMVAKKWDGRSDLAGKTKAQVINLLYADVKSVVKDSGTLYQIYSIFSFYKTIPDESFSTKSSKTKAPLPKPAAVTKLIDLTYRMHPYVGIEEQLGKLPGSKNVKADADEQRRNQLAGFDDALKVNRTLTPDQKEFVRTNYDRLLKNIDKITEDAIRTNFPTERWIKEGLKKSYTGKFSAKELGTLIDYFQGDSGQQFLRYVRLTNMSQMIIGNGGTVDLTDADKAEHDRFVATSLGERFDAAYMHEAIAYEESRENAVRSANPNADGFAIYQPANLNRLFNEFVAANYKK